MDIDMHGGYPVGPAQSSSSGGAGNGASAGPGGGVRQAYSTTRFQVYGSAFEVPPRYTLQRAVGKGAYGVVCSAYDHERKDYVAIKKIAGIVDNAIDCRRTLREMRLLKHFEHENVISIRDVYVPSYSGANFSDIYTVSELMATDLHMIISSNQELSLEHCQYFTYQILRALKHIHSANVLHRDLKPSNILLNGNCDLKICDFGLARVKPEQLQQLTAYVATRWYRAPEIMLCWKDYTHSVDMWSVGCILAEILIRKPLFPGANFLDQLHLIINTIGTPSDGDINMITHESARDYVRNNLMDKPRKNLASLFPNNIPPLLIDLLDKMLVFNPQKRITVEQALEHPYLKELHDPDDEPEGAQPFDVADDEDVSDKTALRRLVWQEVVRYHPELQTTFGMPS